MNAEVHFVHAVAELLSGRVLLMKVNRAYGRLKSESERAMKHAPHAGTAAVRIGTPLEVLTAAAREFKPDLIVIARPKRRRLDAAIGTTAERIIRSTGCSVLVVGSAAQRAYERVAVATDLTSRSVHVTRTLADMGMLKSADTWFVHAFDLPYHHAAAVGTFNARAGIASQAKHDVLQTLGDAGVDLARVHVLTEQARPVDAIQHAMERVQPELLVIGVSRWFALKRILVGSVADQVFRGVNCDILAISPSLTGMKWLHAA
jgi:nucleotide-binding universal stress UspA family protein